MSSNPSPTLLSRRSSTSSGSVPSAMSLDLSNIPPLTQPTPPSNTLLFTNLQDADSFRPENLQTVRSLIEQSAPIHSWAPLKSFRRIVVSFMDEEAAIRVRSVWDGESILGHRTRVYFGKHTPVHARDEHLSLPDAGKLFFISPPPSPPHDWEMRLEDAPNKLVHAEDLAEALAKLHHRANPSAGMSLDGYSPISPAEAGERKNRSRSSTLIWHPEHHGGDPDLPAISVDDMTDEPEEDVEMSAPAGMKPITHTARPPVELMHDA
jgi:hypothetical protein